MSEPTITFLNGFEITPDIEQQLNRLLSKVFTSTNYNGTTYSKQLPHYRLLLWQGKEIIGHLGIDYRVMNLNNNPVRVLGVADLAIEPSLQGKGYGTQLMHAFERLASQHPDSIDFLFLVTDVPLFYERLGYRATKLTIQWLKIHQGKNYGIGNEAITDCSFMIKKNSSKDWSDGDLDMLGYMY